MGPGDLVGERYVLEHLLGKGGMGSVWAARHTRTGRAVALKLLHPRDDDESARRRVLREARAACAALHPSILAVHDVLEAADGSPVLVMDLLEGEPLGARLAREETLSVRQALAVLRPVLGALQAAHAAGIVHRDLKPDNVFLVTGGEVKILDFGVAKLLAKDGVSAGSGALTATGAMIGTPFYMAPEQAFGDPVDARADLWAVGVMLYECLAGAPPTQAENLGQVLRLLTSGNLQPLAERVPSVPPPIAALVGRLLSIDPAGRPASAKEVLEALEDAEVAASEDRLQVVPPPRPAAPADTPDPTARTLEVAPPRRGRAPLLAAAAAAALALAAAAVLGTRPDPPASLPDASEGESPTPGSAPAPVIATTEPIAPEPSAQAAPAPAPSASAPPSPAAGAVPGPASRADRQRRPAPTASAAAAPAASSDTAPTKLLTKVPF